jgi:hypothetical protein
MPVPTAITVDLIEAFCGEGKTGRESFRHSGSRRAADPQFVQSARMKPARGQALKVLTPSVFPVGDDEKLAETSCVPFFSFHKAGNTVSGRQ